MPSTTFLEARLTPQSRAFSGCDRSEKPQHTMCFGDINIWVIPKRP